MTWEMEADKTKDDGKLRTFVTGATRDTGSEKLEPYGFISPLVLHRFSEYMHGHRKQSDNSRRDSDNWQKGFPRASYRHSLLRHLMDWWLVSRGLEPRYGTSPLTPTNEQDLLCAVLFNVQGLLHELLLGRDVEE